MCSNKRLIHLLKHYKNYSSANKTNRKVMHTSSILLSDDGNTKEVAIGFEGIPNKTKGAYLEMVKMFIGRDSNRKSDVQFIYSALKNMRNFSVHKDLDVYKVLINVLPKGKFIPQNIIQAEFMHYPLQQQCIIDLLDQMEYNGVLPDCKIGNMLMDIFGKHGFALKKFRRMVYWMPKLKNNSPWPLPDTIPEDPPELAKMAIARISVDEQTVISVYQSNDVKDSIEDTWIVSSQSPTQKELLMKHNKNEPIYIEGSFKVWLRNASVDYFVLKTNSKNYCEIRGDVGEAKPSLHEQEDGTIYALCATGTNSENSLLSWIKHLEKVNKILADCPVVFKLCSKESTLVPFE